MFTIFNMFTITLNGHSSELLCDIFPPIEVKNTSQLCLLSMQTNNSIPNIEPGCNTIGVRDANDKVYVMTIPTGSYELSDLESAIQKLMPAYSTITINANSNTLKCLIKCSHKIDFTDANSISELLGFKRQVYSADTVHESEDIVNIMKVNCIKIDCNLISGSFSDGKPCQTIHEFFPTVPPGYKIIEVPRHPVFYAINSSTISKVIITLKDQIGRPINLRSEPITVRLQIRSGNGS